MQEKLNISEHSQGRDDTISITTLESKDLPKLSAIAGFQATNKKTTLQDRLPLCKINSPTPESLKTLDRESISKEKVLKPFWTPQLTEIALGLWLPTETDLHDLALTSSDGLLSEAVENSWFSTKLTCHRNKSLLKIYSPSCMCSPAGCTVSEVTKTKLLKISPTADQRSVFKAWTDCSRYVFNQTVGYIRSCVNFTPSWMDIKKDLLKHLPAWCDPIPFQVKGIAIKEAHQAFFKAKGHPKFRSRKNSEQSCFIPKTAIKQSGIYPRVSGPGLYYQESLPQDIKDSRLIWRFEKWWIAIPHKAHLLRAESQGRVVALDPGIRSFMSFYSLDYSGNIGKGDFSRIQRLCVHFDNLISKRDKCTNKQKKRALTKASRRMRGKIKHLISELHFKTAKFLIDNFDMILLPTFETKQMSSKAKRKLRKKSVRSMLTLSHFKFKQILKWKAEQSGKTVVDCSEAYTSKTHPQTGEIKNIGGARWIKLLDGSRACRDIVGARNIMLRALVDSPELFKLAVNES